MRNVCTLPVENSGSGNTNTRHALKNRMPKFLILATLQKNNCANTLAQLTEILSNKNFFERE